MLKVKKKKIILWKVVRNKKSKSWKEKKNDFFKKIVKRKSLKSWKKEWFVIVDICGNEMLSSIALKNGSFVLKIVWKVCP